MKILYVEDNPKDADLARRALAKIALTTSIQVAGTCREAIACLDAEEFDLVLSDLKLPDGDGLSLLSHIRGLNLPCAVVVISGKGDEETAVAALKAGAVDYVVKHKDYLDTLPLVLENALQRHRAERELHASPLRVLYGEHHPADIDLTRRHLSKYAPFIQVEVLNTAPEITQKLLDPKTAQKYDVILLDYSLPGLNTLDLLKEMLQVHKLDLPVVLVTGQGSEDVAVQAIKLGAADYLVKNAGYLFQLPGVLENAFHRAELKREQTALAASEERYRMLAETSQDMIFIINRQGTVEYTNRFAAEALQKKPEEIVGMKQQAIFPAVISKRQQLNISKAFKTAEPLYVEAPAHFPQGILWLGTWLVPLQDETGRVKAVMGVSRDITERRQAEEKIRQLNAGLERRVEERTRDLHLAQEKLVKQEKLAVLGQLAGGVGHELRNPLGVITSAVYYLKLVQPDASDKIKEYHAIIEQELHGAEKIINDLLVFASIKTADLEPVSIPELVQRVLLRYPVPPGVELVRKLPAGLPLVSADPRQMEQVLGNLVVNAYQAMPPTPGRRKKASAPKSQGATLTISASQKEGMVAIAVKDTGMGIPPENMARLFEPLFTTKPKGMGLGLMVSQKLVELNGGRITVKSAPGKGSTFTVFLPVHKKKS